MKEPKKIKLTDAPQHKTVTLTPLLSLEKESLVYDLSSKKDLLEKPVDENHQQNNTQSIQ